MAKFSHNKKELILWVIGIAVFIVILIYLINYISFIARKAREAFSGDLIKSSEIVKFELEKAKRLRR